MTIEKRVSGLALATSSLLLVVPSLAAEPTVPGEPRVMSEPGESVDVPDAADTGDPIDVEVILSYRLDIERSTLTRARAGEQPTDVASMSALTSRLVPELRIGIFHDLAGVARLPIILSQTRDVTSLTAGATEPVTSGAEELFSLPMRSPERSGLEHVAFGFLFGILNQARDPRFPSWTVGAEAQIAVGRAITACDDQPVEGQVRCAAPGDIDRDGERDDEPDFEAERDPGLSRATAALVLHTSISRRIRYVEPFGTLRAKLEFPLSGTVLERQSEGQPSMLPVRGDAELGVGIIPWENRSRYSRVWIDARVIGGIASRGRDISPLFDAIGSSPAASLRAPQDAGTGRAYATGVTVVDAHGSLGAASNFVWRASQLIRLGLGASVQHAFAHAIADDEACVDDQPGCDPPTNPSYRSALDGPQGRFAVASTVIVQIGASGAVTF